MLTVDDYAVESVEQFRGVSVPIFDDRPGAGPLRVGDSVPDGGDTLPVAGAKVAFPERTDGESVLRGYLPTAGVVPAIDALAFYLPFHFFLGNWGIYIREQGLLRLAAAIGNEVVRRGAAISPNVLLDFAYELLWAHEFFHFKTEVACARLNLSPPQFNAAYQHFFDDARAALDEEALANASALTDARRHRDTTEVRIVRSCARSWMKRMGPGYADFAKFEHARHASGRDTLVDRMAFPVLGHPPAMRGRLLYHDVDATHVPTYLVVDGGGVVGLSREFTDWGPLRVWAYTNDHKPPHVHTGVGPGDPRSFRFEWPSRHNMDGAPARIVKQFDAYANRHANEITQKVNKIAWK